MGAVIGSGVSQVTYTAVTETFILVHMHACVFYVYILQCCAFIECNMISNYCTSVAPKLSPLSEKKTQFHIHTFVLIGE